MKSVTPDVHIKLINLLLAKLFYFHKNLLMNENIDQGTH